MALTPEKRRWFTWAGLPIALILLGLLTAACPRQFYRLEWLHSVSPFCWGSGLLAVMVLGLVLALTRLRTRVARIAAVGASLLALLAIAYVGALVVVVSGFEGERSVTSVVHSPDGRFELVVESYSVMIDPAYDVWLREREGLFARRVLVWTSREDVAVSRVAFVEPNQIEVTDSGGNTRGSHFDADTLELSQAHCLGIWCPDSRLPTR